MSTDSRKIDVLDDGFVRLVDYYGDDRRIVDAARVSIAGEGVKAVTKDEFLIRYLMRHRHTTPFEMVDFTFHVKVPIFIGRQWMRHRTFSYNEMSGRYSELPEEYYIPDPKHINFQAPKNKQGRADEPVSVPLASFFIKLLQDSCINVFKDYHTFLGKDVDGTSCVLTQELKEELDENGGFAREISRMGLPLCTYTEYYAKANLWNWFHFLGLRLDGHAQYEIRVYAEAVAKFIKEACPIAWSAFEDYRLNAMYLTSHDVNALRMILNSHKNIESSYEFPTKRELTEFRGKLRRLVDG